MSNTVADSAEICNKSCMTYASEKVDGIGNLEMATPAVDENVCTQSEVETEAGLPQSPAIGAASPTSSELAANDLVFTVITSTKPDRLAKVLGLNPDGTMSKSASANMVEGRAQRKQVAGLEELGRALEGLETNQAVTWGVCEPEDVAVVTTADLPSHPGAIARNGKHFLFRNEPGVMMLDHDGCLDEDLDGAAFRQRLIDACPALVGAPMLGRPSASAGVETSAGHFLTGLTRHRLYIPVTDASEIPATGKRLVELLWAAGFGWFEVGKAGQALERTLVDAAVWQPERLDLAAPPVLNDGLVRPAVKSVIYGAPTALFDLAQVVVDPSAAKRAAKNKSIARVGVVAECAVQRQVWVDKHAPALATERGIPVVNAHAVLDRASKHATLLGDFMLTASDGRRVSVDEVLDDPKAWNNVRFADPLEPDDDRRVAVVTFFGGLRPSLYTHRHGGMRFDLSRNVERVQIGKGLRIETTDAVLSALRTHGELFEFGDASVAFVDGNRARRVNEHWLMDHVGRVCSFFSMRKRSRDSAEMMEVAEDAPQGIATAILAKHGARHFPQLVAVISAPTLRVDGSILDQPGHDKDSGLFYVAEASAPEVPELPTPEDALAALAVLWKPFAEFPLVDDTSRGVVLNAILTAALRASLPTALGIGLDAPAAGTGKTLLAQCFGVIATGIVPPMLPPTANDEEMRKRLFSLLLAGVRVIVWDNVREPLGGAALDAFLTADTFTDRVLCTSEVPTVPNRALFIATGNNLQPIGDTCRRILIARLDAKIDKPYARDFDFNPVTLLKQDRVRYVVAALTIVRAHIAAGSPKEAKGRTASYEEWDDLVRQPLCWLSKIAAASTVKGIPTFSDPLAAVDTAYEEDPDCAKHEALLNAWHNNYANAPTTIAAAIDYVSALGPHAGKAKSLRDAINDIALRGVVINAGVLGKWMDRFNEKRIGGLWSRRGTVSAGRRRWCVESDPTRSVPAAHTEPTAPTLHAKAMSPSPSVVGLVGVGGVLPADPT